MNPFEYVGRRLIGAAQGAGDTLILLSKSVYWCKAAWRNRDKILHQMLVCGVESVPVAGIVALFSGMVMALQTGHELLQFNLQETIGIIVSGSMLREIGPVFTSVIVAGRVGTAMAAEIGTMKVSEEIDALETMSINPVRFLVMPRFVALILMLPVITVFDNAIGIFGGAVVGKYQIGVEYHRYFDWAFKYLEYKDLFSGLLKSVVFAVTIVTISCSQGLKASSGAEGVGQGTIRSVVFSFLFIIIFDYFLTRLFF